MLGGRQCHLVLVNRGCPPHQLGSQTPALPMLAEPNLRASRSLVELGSSRWGPLVWRIVGLGDDAVSGKVHVCRPVRK